jgi:D-alanyl-D-alanine carboxypeptidase
MLFSLLANLTVLFGISFLFLPNFVVTIDLPTADSVKPNFITQVFTPKIPLPKDNQSVGMKITAGSSAVLDLNSGAILWSKNSVQPRPLASITKLMTALVFLDHKPDWQTKITIEEKDFREGNRSAFPSGREITVQDLFFSSLVSSSNTATVALARSTGLSSEDFIKAMNDKARVLGLADTKFIEVTGLDPNNVSTARDVLLLAKAAFSQPDIREATIKSEHRLPDGSVLKNTDQLLNSYLNISAGKTGSLDEAGYCLVSEVVGKDGQAIIVAVLGSATTFDRFQDLKAVAQWTFDNFIWPKK